MKLKTIGVVTLWGTLGVALAAAAFAGARFLRSRF